MEGRCFVFVGPDLGLKGHFALANFIPDAFTAEAITVFGDGIPLGACLDQVDISLWVLHSVCERLPKSRLQPVI